jgi:adenosylcobinamide kinase/adenosylcobinamide-phosphate guanylyltransferase
LGIKVSSAVRFDLQKLDRKAVTLMLGGVRSGKSHWAQEYAVRSERVAFIATAHVFDAEIKVKILRHQQERPAHWTTIEEPLLLAQAITDHAASRDVLLIDCLTVYISNRLFAAESNEESSELANSQAKINQYLDDFLRALRDLPTSVVLVSDEVGSGVVPPYPAWHRFRDALGELNQRVAAQAENVMLLVAGLPLALKGSSGAPA